MCSKHAVSMALLISLMCFLAQTPTTNVSTTYGAEMTWHWLRYNIIYNYVQICCNIPPIKNKYNGKILLIFLFI